jgi:hypothetical protein
MGGTDYKYEGHACVEHHVIPTISQWWRAATEFERIGLRTCNFNRYEGTNNDDAHVQMEYQALHTNDQSKKQLEDTNDTDNGDVDRKARAS